MTSSKIVATIIAVVVFMVIFVPIVGFRTDAGMKTPGIFGLIAFFAFIYALKAIWKKEDKDDKGDDHSAFQK